jgi:hypothetical protein
MTNTVAALGKRPLLGGRKMSPAVFTTRDWLLRVAAKSGVGFMMAQIKEFTTNCRLCAIEGTVVPRDRFTRMFNSRALSPIGLALRTPKRTQAQKDILVQLSYIGRSLPKGRVAKEGLKAQAEHYQNLGTPAPALDESRRESLRGFALQWAERHLSDFDTVYKPELDPSSGACLEFSRKQGGMAEYLRRCLHEVMGEVPHYLKKITAYPLRTDDLAFTAHGALLNRLYRRLQTILDEDGFPRAQVLSIPERGFKTRIVTKSPGCLVALGHHIRRWMTVGIRRDDAIREVLAGDHREAVESLFHRTVDPFQYHDESSDLILSADLKTATDLLAMEANECLLEGLLASKPGQSLPPWAVKVFRTCLGPMVLEYPELGRFSRSKRGALMGLPTTWPMLCLANLAWWSIRGGKIIRPPRVRICGDDLVAKASRAQIAAYEENALACGAKFSSRAKHMALQDGGVFTEEVFFTTGPKAEVRQGPSPGVRDEGMEFLGKHYVYKDAAQMRALHSRRPRIVVNDFLCWSDAFPTRGIIGTMKSDLTGSDAPFWVALGPALEQMMRHRSEKASQRMLRAFNFAHPEFKRHVATLGMSGLIHVPRIFGGFGIPRARYIWNFRPLAESGPQRLLIVAAKALALGTRPGGDFQTLARPWQEATAPNPVRSAASRAAEIGLEARYLIGSKRDPAGLPVGAITYPGEVHELLDRIVGNVARDMFFLSDVALTSGEAKHRNSALLLKTVRRRLNRARTALLKEKGGWLFKKERAREKKLAGRVPKAVVPATPPRPQVPHSPEYEGDHDAPDTPEAKSLRFLEAARLRENVDGDRLAFTFKEVGAFSMATWQDLIDRVVKHDLDRVAILLPTAQNELSSADFEKVEKVLSDPKTAEALNVPLREFSGIPTKRASYRLFGL